MPEDHANGGEPVEERDTMTQTGDGGGEAVERTGWSSPRFVGPYVLLGVATGLLFALGAAAAAAGVTPGRESALSLGFDRLTPVRAAVGLALVGAIGYLLVKKHRSRLLRALFAAALVFAVAGLAVEAVFSPPSSYDVVFEAEYADSSNLTYGSELAEGLREGRGLKYRSGLVATYRMPGYPTLVALTGAIGGAAADDWFHVTQLTIWAQIFLTALAVGIFAFVAAPRFGRVSLLVIVFLLALMPTGVRYTQVDSVMVAMGLFVMAAILPFIDRTKRRDIGWLNIVVLHTAFGAYWLFRTEVLLAWIAVSLMVHWGQWRRLLLPAAMFVTLAVSFGTYTATNGNEFTIGTNNLGHVAFVGLFDTPGHRFVWEPKDESYDDWIMQYGYQYRRPGANAFAVKEVARFAATYPGYVMTAASHKWFQYFTLHFASNDFAVLDHYKIRASFREWMQNGGAWAFVVFVAVALIIGYRRYRTALLAWGFLFTLPPFLVLQSEARFTRFVGISLIIAAVPLILDRGFYRAVLDRWKLALPVVAVLAVIWIVGGPPLDRSLLDLDGFRYWTPVLDPDDSTLSVFR